MKDRLFKDNSKLKIIGIAVLLLLVPLFLVVGNQIQNYRSSAASPDKLETEAGVLTSAGVTKQSDSGASGGQYVMFNQNSGPTSTPIPTSPPSSSGEIYGPGIAAADLNNTKIGGPSNQKGAYRFRSQYSGALNSVVLYTIDEQAGSGYGEGNGGNIRLTLETNASGNIPSGNALATYTISNPPRGFGTYTFPSPPTLSAGTIYHLVFTNTASSPTSNYSSIDNTYNDKSDDPFQPKYNNTDWAELVKIGTNAWSDRRSSGVNTPVMQLNFANGSKQGMGYMETWGRNNNHNRVNGTIRLREVFTVSEGSRTATGVAVRVARTNGSSPLMIRLENSNGSIIEEVSVPATNVPTKPLGGSGHGFGQTWHKVNFSSPRTLTNGNTYNLVLYTSSGTEYWTTVLASGTPYGFTAPTHFTDGRSQIALNGSTWQNTINEWGVVTDRGDLQFYFTLQ